MIDQNKSLEQLTQVSWGEPEFKSGLVTRVHQLVKIPLEKMTVEDLRVLISQEISLDYLLPIAFEKLKKNPWAEGDFYAGDLLHAVCKASDRKEFEIIGERIFEIINRAMEVEHPKDDESVIRDCAAMIPSTYIK